MSEPKIVALQMGAVSTLLQVWPGINASSVEFKKEEEYT